MPWNEVNRMSLKTEFVALSQKESANITELHRGNALEERECNQHKPHKRFQKNTPNKLWQIDFKGDFPTLKERCYPLSVLDDCTRFVPGLYSYGDQKRETVQACLEHVFQHYRLPCCMAVLPIPRRRGKSNGFTAP